MNVPTISVPTKVAREKLRAYRKALHRRADAEYEAAAAGYAALAEGKTLVSLTDAIRAAGFDMKMRPKVAVARADRRQVHFAWPRYNRWGRFDSRQSNAKGRTLSSLDISIDFGRTPGMWVDGYALVPMVPADVRAAVPGQMREYFVLWEVEQWSDYRLLARPDRDPYLLKHVHGDLYAIYAEWDLTDLERAVMAGRAIV